MTGEAPELGKTGEPTAPTGGREVSLRTAVVIFGAVVLTVAVAGSVIGYRFFWTPRQPSQAEMAAARWEAEARRDPKSVVAWTEWGVALYEKGERQEAIEKLSRALQLEPRAARARYYLGVAYIDEGRYDDAINVLKDILTRDINNPLVFTQIARAYEGKKDYKTALQNLDYIIEFIDPSLTEVHYERGVVLEKMGKRTEAIAAYRKSASLDPEYKPAADALRRLGQKVPRPEDVLPGAPPVFHGGAGKR